MLAAGGTAFNLNMKTRNEIIVLNGQDSMVWVEALIQFDGGEFLSTVYQVEVVEKTVSKSSILSDFHLVFLFWKIFKYLESAFG